MYVCKHEWYLCGEHPAEHAADNSSHIRLFHLCALVWYSLPYHTDQPRARQTLSELIILHYHTYELVQSTTCITHERFHVVFPVLREFFHSKDG